MKNKIIIVLSYLAVAAAAATLTLVLTAKPAHYTKLEELADLLEECFIDGVDRTEMEDAAADAMVEALGDRWSYYILPASTIPTRIRRRIPMWVSASPFPPRKTVISLRR